MSHDEGFSLGLGLGLGLRSYGVGDSVVAPQTRLYNASKISSAFTALEGASSNRVNLVWLGHSIISGVCSDNTTGQTFSNAPAWRTNCIPAKCADALVAGIGGTVGRGLETFALAHAGYFTLGGGAAVSVAYTGAGIGGYAVVLSSATHTASFVAQGTAVRVYGYSTATGTVARYQINGGSVTNAPAAGSTGTGYGARVWYEFDITGLTNGDTVTLLGASSGTWVLDCVDLNLLTTAGITMHRQSYSGLMLGQLAAPSLDGTDTNPSTATQWVNDANEAVIRAQQGQSILTRMSPSLVLVTTDVNDIKGANGSGTAWSWTPATHKRHMTNLAQFLAGYSLPLLIVTGTIRDPSANTAEGQAADIQDQIIAVYKEVSDEQPNVAFFDWTTHFATGEDVATRYAAQQASGYIQDAVHPNQAGAVFFGELVADAILAELDLTPSVGSSLLMENGDDLLMENGDRLLLEA